MAIGHSGLTGYGTIAPIGENVSWATGKDPAVNSIYRRLLREHPALKGHNYNQAVDGSRIVDMLDQIDGLVEVTPVPDIFIIQSLDNDIRCDGTDQQNLKPFGADFTKVLQKIVKMNPNARIYVVSAQLGVVMDWARFIARTPEARDAFMGPDPSPCAALDEKGRVVAANVAFNQRVIDAYEDVLADTCKRFRQCQYDHGALHNMPFRARDVTDDFGHLSIAGHRHAAAVLWEAFDWK